MIALSEVQPLKPGNVFVGEALRNYEPSAVCGVYTSAVRAEEAMDAQGGDEQTVGEYELDSGADPVRGWWRRRGPEVGYWTDWEEISPH